MMRERNKWSVLQLKQLFITYRLPFVVHSPDVPPFQRITACSVNTYKQSRNHEDNASAAPELPRVGLHRARARHQGTRDSTSV